MTNESWFVVDKEGLASLLATRGAWFAVFELFQNAVDEDGVTDVKIELSPIEGRRGVARLVVSDDAPEGFDDLTHAFRLFAPSKKKKNPEKRGRFNLGEKLVLAICESAEIVSTKGGYLFDSEGRHKLRRTVENGSVFDAVIRMTRPQVEETNAKVFSLIPPPHVCVTYNGEVIPPRAPIHTFTCTLPTLIETDNEWRPTRRQTNVEIYEPIGDEEPMIYEMGIPVVESGDRWHVNVEQKVPLNSERDNVTPAYLRTLRTNVLNETYRLVTAEDATQTWVSEALSDPAVDQNAVTAVVEKLYGADAVVHDMHDPEANKLAVAQGRTVIPPNAFSKTQWDNIRRTETFLPAGQVTPSNSELLTSTNGVPPIPEEKWTDGMRRMVAYAQTAANLLLDCKIQIEIFRMPIGPRWLAAYGDRNLRFNLGQLGNKFFDEPDQVKTDQLLIHEFGHHYSTDHLASQYHDALCRLGAKMRMLGWQLTAAWNEGQEN